MNRNKFDADAWLASDLSRNVRPYTIDADRGIVQTDGSAADHANALEMAKAMLALRGGASLGQDGHVDVNAAPASAPTRSPYATVGDAITYWQTVDMGAMRLKATAEDRLKAIEEFASTRGGAGLSAGAELVWSDIQVLRRSMAWSQRDRAPSHESRRGQDGHSTRAKNLLVHSRHID